MAWSDSVRISGQSSKAGPVLAASGGRLHLIHIGESSNSIWHSRSSGGGFSANVVVPEQRSRATPGIADFNGQVHMVHIGDSSNDLWHSIFNGTSWNTNVKISGQKSKDSPALAAFNSQLHMVHIGDDANDLWHSFWNGRTWNANIRIEGQKSRVKPALAAFGGQLHMVHIGDSANDLWHSTYDGTHWSPNAPIHGQKSASAPALAVLNNRLHLVHLGEASDSIWYSQYDGTSWTVNVRVPGQTSSAPPSIAPLASGLRMAWKGSGRSLELFTSSTDGELSVVRIGFKLAGTAAMNLDAVVRQMRQVYSSVGIDVVEVAARETINVPGDIAMDVDVDHCTSKSNTSELRELMSHRNNLGPRDVAVYVVNTIRTPTARGVIGCASHPSDLPGCVVMVGTNGFVVGHEVGHVLGLHHVGDSNNLMFPTTAITNRPPDITYAQALTMADSSSTIE